MLHIKWICSFYVHKETPTGYTLCELRRYLGGALHFASLHEALAEQSALGSLVRGTDSLTLDYVASVSNQLS